MDISEIRRQLESDTTGHFPREAMTAAIAQKDEIIPGLLEILERTRDNAKELADKPGYMAHLLAMFLLAEFREVKAHHPVVDLFRLPPAVFDDLLGEFTDCGLERVLASVCGGDVSLIVKVIEDVDASDLARSSAVAALVVLAASGVAPRGVVVDHFRRLLNGGLERRPSLVWESLAPSCADIHPGELLDDIRRAYAEGMIDGTGMTLEEVEADAGQDPVTVLSDLRGNKAYSLVTDAVEDTYWWDCFDDGVVNDFGGFDYDDPDAVDEDFDDGEFILPYVREDPKVGRNDPCPCGSGKKYKKCCAK